MPTYQVDCCTIDKTEIERVRVLPDFDRIILVLSAASTNPLKLNMTEVFAAKASDVKIMPGGTMAFTVDSTDSRTLANDWIKADLRVSEKMLQKVSTNLGKKIKSLALWKTRVYKHSTGTEYVGYKVKIEHQ